MPSSSPTPPGSDADRQFVILISNVESRKGFDVVNSVYHHFGPQCCLLAANQRTGWLIRWAYRNPVYQLRDDSFANFEQDLLSLLRLPQVQSKTVVYLPVEEQTTLWFYQFLAHHRTFDRLRSVLPDEPTFQLSRHKLRLAQFCLANGFKVPRVLSPAEFPSLRQNFRPLLVKPVIGSGGRGIRRIDTPEQLQTTVVGESEFAQERIDCGPEVEGAFFLCAGGEVVTAFTHKRIRTAPRTGGVTVLSQCTQNPRLIATGAAILKTLRWNGLAMLEFVYDARSGEYLLLEINPRLWGSILLSEFCGAKLIRTYVQLALGQAPEKTAPRSGTYIRWLFPYDILSLLKGQLRWRELWFTPTDPVCYIGFTFSSWPRSISFAVASALNRNNLKKLAQKIGNRCF